MSCGTREGLVKVVVWREGWVDVPGTYCVERESDY